MFNIGKKYKLGKKETASRADGKVLTVHRVIALRDIPLHGVKAGDVGGYIESKENLMQDGDCWVGGNAFVSGRAKIQHNALVTDDVIVHSKGSGPYPWIGGNAVARNSAIIQGKSFVIYENAIIQDNALLIDTSVADNALIKDKAVLSGVDAIDHAVISGNAKLVNVKVRENAVVTDNARVTEGIVSGSSFIGGNARVEDSKIRDNTHISGQVKVNEGTLCEGNTKLSGELIIPPRQYLFNKTIEGESTSFFGDLPSEQNAISASTVSSMPEETTLTVEDNTSGFSLSSIVSAIEKEYKTYSTDIVKLIKYPVMVDPTVPQTQEFLFTLRQAKRFTGDEKAQRELAEKLERSFMVAEAHALKLTSSVYSEEERKKTEDAKQFINKACADTSSIVEKKNSFRATVKALEGVVALPEEAIDAYREKIGLLEIEA